MKRKHMLIAISIIAILSLSIVSFSVFAQGNALNNIELGNHLGSINAGQAQLYTFSVNTPQIVSVQVLSLTDGFTPSFEFWHDEVRLPNMIDPWTNEQLDTKVALPVAGEYTLRVSTRGYGTSQSGDYVVSIQYIGEYLENEIALPIDSVVSVEMTDDSIVHRHWFNGNPDRDLVLYVQTNETLMDVSASVRNVTRTRDVGSATFPLGSAAFCIPQGTDNYWVDIMNNGNEFVNYQLALSTETMLTCGDLGNMNLLNRFPLADTVMTSPSINEDFIVNYNDCIAEPSHAVNVRQVPSTSADVIAVAHPENIPNVTGWAREGQWVEVQMPDGRSGFIHTGVVNLAQACITLGLPDVPVDQAILDAIEFNQDDSPAGLDTDVTTDSVDVEGNAGVVDTTTSVDVEQANEAVDEAIDTVEDVVEEVEVPIEVPTLPPVSSGS